MVQPATFEKHHTNNVVSPVQVVAMSRLMDNVSSS